MTAYATTAVSIDYSSLYVPRSAPPGTMTKLRAAARLAARNNQCVAVTGGGYMSRRQRDRDHPDAPYYVTCAGIKIKNALDINPHAYNVYFTEADLRAGRVHDKPKSVPRNQAISLCVAAVRHRLQYPSSAHFDPWTVQAGTGGTLNQRIVVDFTALNGYGNRVPGRGVCIIDPHQRVDVSVTRH